MAEVLKFIRPSMDPQPRPGDYPPVREPARPLPRPGEEVTLTGFRKPFPKETGKVKFKKVA